MPFRGENDGDWSRLLDSHVHEHGQLYYRLAYGVLRCREAAHDACQQAFLKAWQQRGRIRERRALKSWLVRVVMNESLAVLRRGRTEHRIMTKCAGDSDGNADCCPLEASERRDSVIAALACLEEPVRTVVTLRTMQEMSGNEVSRLLGVTASQVSRWLHQGLDQLRGILAGQLRGEE